ncbi:MAG: protein kinase [Kofleriaceae bacterium]
MLSDLAQLAGQTLAGRYHVLELLGAGGMGAVYRAHDRELDELIALKVIRHDRASRHGMVEQFRNEVKLARRVTHINIARTFELGSADGIVYCTMELVDGESLRRRIKTHRVLAIAEAAMIARALCDGLAVAHAASVIHRDIKPDNILLAPDGRVVLADFGVAVMTATHEGGLSGTLEYMAPEQARGEAPTPAVDVYAVGCVLFEMLAGFRAFAGTTSELIVAKQDVERVTFDVADVLDPDRVPAELVEIVGRATARDPSERIATARELGILLEPWLAMQPAIAPRAKASSAHLKTVVVLAPRGHEAKLHLAEGVHHELLRRLVLRPKLRVLPRVHGVDVPGATYVELHAGESLTVTIRRDTTTTLQLPLDIENLGLTAEMIANAVSVVVVRHPDPAAEALELLLRARELVHRGFAGVRPALELLRRAHAMEPDDPHIAASLAAVLARFVFFGRENPAELDLARSLVANALANAPEVAESHVANGYLELHTGKPERAAQAFRTAIACSPYVAESHEGLGRMLIEAGFLADAMARLEDALAITPSLNAVRWDIARAHALERNWVVYDADAAELQEIGDRATTRMRIAAWRGDRATLQTIRWQLMRDPDRLFEPGLATMLVAVALDGGWNREALLEYVDRIQSMSLRRLALVDQIGAEVAGLAGDTETCMTLVERAVDHELFDLHWLARCPLLDATRGLPRFAAAAAIVKRRADAILDALYGDASKPTSSGYSASYLTSDQS